MGTLILITNGMQSAEKVSCWNSAVSITLIICATVLLISVGIILLLYYNNLLRLNTIKDKELAEKAYNLKLKESQEKEKIEEEKRLYRKQIASILEKCAIGKVTTTEYGKEKETKVSELNDDKVKAYVDKLADLIDKLTPTQ